MNFQIGQKLKCIMGIRSSEHLAFIETGDTVTVAGIYRHHILVERPYKSGKGMMRECFCRNGIERNLAPVNAKAVKSRRHLQYDDWEDKAILAGVQNGLSYLEIGEKLGIEKKSIALRYLRLTGRIT